MILLDLDPNIVKPGWTPFLITIGLAAVMYLLFRSMRRQFRRVDANYLANEQPAAAGPVAVVPDVEEELAARPGDKTKSRRQPPRG